MDLSKKFLTKRILTNIAVGWTSKLLISLSGVILTPMLIKGLGKYEYGIWVAIGQLISFLLLADLGVANSIGRLISKYDAMGLIEKKQHIFFLNGSAFGSNANHNHYNAVYRKCYSFLSES